MNKYIKPTLEFIALRSEERFAGYQPEYCYQTTSPNTQNACDPTYHPTWTSPGPDA